MKFSKREFKKWLDVLAAVVVKTRDGFQCQIVHDPACAGIMNPGDRNCQCCHIISRKSNNTRWDLLNLITGCGHCHEWAHRNPHEFGLWFGEKYPHRIGYLNGLEKQNRTWKEKDFRFWEAFLLQKAVELNVDYLNIPERYRKRFKRRTEEIMLEGNRL